MHSSDTYSSPLEICPFFSRMSLVTALFAITLAVSLANSRNFYLNELGFKQPNDKSASAQNRLVAGRNSRSDWDH